MKLIADDGTTLESYDDETFGEVAVRGQNLFSGPLDDPKATAAAFDEGWFMTGDSLLEAARQSSPPPQRKPYR
jgi:malonyl-CoA/methylmalonyl-CoA synthetase